MHGLGILGCRHNKLKEEKAERQLPMYLLYSKLNNIHLGFFYSFQGSLRTLARCSIGVRDTVSP